MGLLQQVLEDAWNSLNVAFAVVCWFALAAMGVSGYFLAEAHGWTGGDRFAMVFDLPIAMGMATLWVLHAARRHGEVA